MVALNMPIVNDIEPKREKPVPKEHVSLNCRYGLVMAMLSAFLEQLANSWRNLSMVAMLLSMLGQIKSQL